MSVQTYKYNFPVIILSKPQLGRNIGSIARVMKNFCFQDLRIINPRDGWPNEEATATDLCSAVVSVELTSTDQIVVSEEDGTYLLHRIFTAIDECGNESTATQVITVNGSVAVIIPNYEQFEVEAL